MPHRNKGRAGTSANLAAAGGRAVAVFLAIGILLVLAILSPGRSSADQLGAALAAAAPASATLQQGIDDYDRGNYDKAIAELTKAQQADPSRATTALYLALCYMAQQRFGDEVAVCQHYLNVKPSLFERKSDLQREGDQYIAILQVKSDHEQAVEAIANEINIAKRGDPNTIAVTDYRNIGPADPDLNDLGKGMAYLLIEDVAKVPGLVVIDRGKYQAVAQELKLASSGIEDPKTAARTGRSARCRQGHDR